MQCTFEVFTDNQWIECCTITLTDERRGWSSSVTLDYDMNYAFSGTIPVSLRYPVNADHLRMPEWPSFLFDLVPQGQGRRYLQNELGLPDTQSADWKLLCAGAFNPIGNLRIKEAVEFYKSHVAKQNPTLAAKGFKFEDIIEREEAFIEHLQIHGMLSSGTSGVQGLAPKFLITLGKDSLWYADGALPDHLAAKHYIIKLPRGKNLSDQMILRNEARYIQVAHRMGLVTEETPTLHGGMLFIPRFDRQVIGQKVLRIQQESLASLAGQVGYDIRPTQNDLFFALMKYATDPVLAAVEFITRDVLNISMGNTDNHGRNTAVQTTEHGTQLTPLFDFAPMYLDKEGIPRASRWKGEQNQELRSWVDVLDQLERTAHQLSEDPLTQTRLTDTDFSDIREELTMFAIDMERLSEVMSYESVDPDIISHRQHAIVEQIFQLRELSPRARIAPGHT